ncbi:type II toxin-antitoxin system VapC family toxin [Granulicella mallensis]|uniref:PilT protein domain protein n=1 Tax=Granulicella mallensis (strain ATCC BAA-1857 / DSM 23137 / MP5ACTX8) TaxID=682795 RepID=G8P1Y5_GRAMM|nr:PIN domain-containing protein [Granulicella mallensis]AEU37037.1 PilT protein domain protein [Granulicella mallensis MP5ACTX8]
MSRVFWDAMLFIYLVENHPQYFKRCRYLLQRSFERGDKLYTSHLALGEVLAGAEKSPFPSKSKAIQAVAEEMGFTGLPFDAGAVPTFADLRAKRKLKIADSIHLACAASAGMDLFLTGDAQLAGIHVPGIQFVAAFQTTML